MKKKPSPLQFVLLNIVVATMGGGAFFAATKFPAHRAEPRSAGPAQSREEFQRLTNAHFVAERLLPDLLPRVSSVKFAIEPGDHAIWGATGRDADGHIWFATSAYNHPVLTARLHEYDPATQTVTGRGDVVNELKSQGIWHEGEQQPKIHTKIIQADDGHLYFASMDEPRPGEVGERPPPWGSHLWRLRMPERTWEHLHAAKEGIIALTGGGSNLFALSFPDHTLMHYDIRTGLLLRRQHVGSVEGHISRNIFVDGGGHVYVPRLKYVRPNHAEHTLVEFDSDLNEVGENPLPYYQDGAAQQCHGIIAFQQLADQSIVFTTHAGRLFRVVPRPGEKSELLDLGWFHPDGKAYSPALFTDSGEDHIYGLARRDEDGGQGFAWIHHNRLSGKSEKLDLLLPPEDGGPTTANLLYGCQTTDDKGGFYVVGIWTTPSGQRPVVLRVAEVGEK